MPSTNDIHAIYSAYMAEDLATLNNIARHDDVMTAKAAKYAARALRDRVQGDVNAAMIYEASLDMLWDEAGI